MDMIKKKVKDQNRISWLVLLAGMILMFVCNSPLDGADDPGIVLWEKGTGKYNNYRIPSLIVAPNGDLLAFCEGREGGDAGDINLLMKRSKDLGETWNEEIIVWDDAGNTCGNPCPVVDRINGRIWLYMTWNLGSDHEREIVRRESQDTRRPYLCYSDDNGFSWTKPVEMTRTCKDPAWGWYATGPGIGIQMQSEKFRGRLIIPANHSYDDPEGNIRQGPFAYGSHVLISDDYGKTWRKSLPIRPGCNESQVVELSDGTLMMNMRSYNDEYCRAVATSTDGGETWTEISHDRQLVESKCQASFINYGKYKDLNMLLFSNPAVAVGRTHMTIKASFNDGQHWSISRCIHPGPAAYSCLTRMENGEIGILYECGDKHRYERIVFQKFPPEQLFEMGD
jgi:sialidase-1